MQKKIIMITREKSIILLAKYLLEETISYGLQKGPIFSR